MNEQMKIAAADGFSLAATEFSARTPSATRVVVAGATGVAQGFYRKMASFIADRGHPVVTFDYRGIGRSRLGGLRGFEASFVDWACLDLEAVVAWSLARGPTVVVGHSFGGHAFGFLSRANETLGLYAFGTGAGWHGHMPLLERPKVVLLWNVVGPYLTARHGYLPSKRIGLGEDLPLGVYAQWKRWCGFPHYFFDDPEFRYRESFQRVKVPIVAVNASDDRWAPPRSSEAFFSGYRQAPVSHVSVATQGHPIGHMGYFRPRPGEPLWRGLAEWIEDQSGGRSQGGQPPC